jgi:hypothetical protein
MPVSKIFLDTQIAATEAAITAWTAAQTAFATNGLIKTYKLDTGQTIQTVTREDADLIQKTIDSLYNQLSTLCARRDGAASVVRPSW